MKLKLSRVTVITLGGLFGTLCAVTLAVRDMAAIEASKVAVCHFDADGLPNAPTTLLVGNQNAADKHVANHNTAKGHKGDDFLGVCAEE